MNLQTETHDGVCTHCQTNVPNGAIVCTGCGARWGFSNGLNRQQLYDAFKFQYHYGRILVFGSILTMLFVYFIGTNDSGTNFGLGLGSFVVLIIGGAPFTKGWQQTHMAKKGSLDWWRSH